MAYCNNHALCNIKKKPVITNEMEQQAEPNEASTDTNVKSENNLTQPDTQSTINPDGQYELLSGETLQRLDNLIKNLNQIDNPFELAELLYLTGHTEKAAILYKEALNRKDPNDPDAAREKAWILFQTGNCLRNEKSQAAKDIYRKLIAEYPDHPWTDFAKVQEKIIDWYLKDKPQTLITECKQLIIE